MIPFMQKLHQPSTANCLGSDRSVGVAGGWLQVNGIYNGPIYYGSKVIQGGGHGLLSNTMGMGVDRVVSGSFLMFWFY